MKDAYDVIVIGSGTAGCYFARRMAEQGYRTLVADALPPQRLGEQLPLFHVDKDMFAKLGVPMPRPGDPDYITEFEAGSYYSPFGQYKKRNDGTEIIVLADYPFLACNLPAFVRRLRTWCLEVGVEFADETRFEDFIYDRRGVCGAKLRTAEGLAFVRSRLVADCSGWRAVARRKLRRPSYVENFSLGPRDIMFTILKYVKLAHPEEDAPKRAEHWAYYKSWIGQAPEPDQAIFGTGACNSFAYAETCSRRFAEAIDLPEGEVVKEGRGLVPFRRAPYSLVDNGFMVMGDAACMNKWVGEGICSGWVGCQIAAETAARAMKGGAYPTRDALWDYNVRYNRGQAASFAYINATTINAVDCDAEEMDYEFREGIIFNNKAMTRLNQKYSAAMPLNEALELVVKVTKGFTGGSISFRTLKGLVRGVGCASLLKAHYQCYPRNPAYYAPWARFCDYLWAACGTIADATDRYEERIRQAEERLSAQLPARGLKAE
ncbi:MAG: NAD(P)/FAD-dependent oxidoreductase [Oscillospiraceae bacterium]|jgi:flavin-dependent dehydrogenase|nr:NAD(P)/FAD-dependent oxidoreductase [Oscillospiraceae bacterium]